MIDEQIFHHLLLIGDGLGRFGMNRHPIPHRRLAGGHHLRNPLDLHQANPTGGDDAQPRMIAILRQMNPRIATRLQHHLALLRINDLSVHGDLGHSGGIVY